MAPWPQRAPLPCPRGGKPMANAIHVTGTPALPCPHVGDPTAMGMSSWGPCLFSHPLLKSPLPIPPCPELPVLVFPLGPPQPICQTHRDPLDAPQPFGVMCRSPRLRAPSLQSLTCHIPASTSTRSRPGCHQKPRVSLLLWALPSSPACQLGTSLPAYPQCPPCGEDSLPVTGPWHPLPPLQAASEPQMPVPLDTPCDRPAPHGRLAGSPLPAQDRGGLRWCRWPTLGVGDPRRSWWSTLAMEVSAGCWWPVLSAAARVVGAAWGAAWGAMGPSGARGCF